MLEGVLTPKLTPNGLPGWTASRSRLFDPARVDRLLKAHTPPAGWITEAEAARRADITTIALQSRAETRNWRVVADMTGTRWLDPAHVVDEHVDVTGMLTAAELLTRAGVSATRTLTSRVAKMARAGALPGAVLAVPLEGRARQWWFPDAPELIVQVRDRIAWGHAAYAKQTEAGQTYHATVRDLHREASAAALAPDRDEGRTT